MGSIKPIKPNELTKEMIERPNNVNQLVALAKSGGYELTIVEAEAYLSEFADKELNEESLARVSCGLDWPSGCRHTIRFVIVTILFEETITYEEKELVLRRGSALNIIRPHGSFAAPA